MLITITETAKSHFLNIMSHQSKEMRAKELNLRIQAIKAGTSKASIELSYCLNGEQNPSDIAIDAGSFTLYVDKDSEQALTNAIIDYKEDQQAVSGKLHIKAPFLKGQDCVLETDSETDDLSLFKKIKNFLNEEINPSLARHNGMVKLAELNNIEDGVEVVLQFGGGCKGCSMIDFTLKQGIEKSLRNKFSEIILIRDATDHEAGKNPFCK